MSGRPIWTKELRQHLTLVESVYFISNLLAFVTIPLELQNLGCIQKCTVLPSTLSIVGGLCLALPVILVQSHPAVWNYRIQAEAVWNYRIQAVFFQVKVSQTWTWQWPAWLGCSDYYNQFHMVDCGRVWDFCVTLFDAKREHNGRCERPCVSPFSSAKHLFFGPSGLSIFYLFYTKHIFKPTKIPHF